jgi:hypothetical protein
MPSVKDCAHLKMKINDLICALGFLFNPISACHPKLINVYENWHEKTGRLKKNLDSRFVILKKIYPPKTSVNFVITVIKKGITIRK